MGDYALPRSVLRRAECSVLSQSSPPLPTSPPPERERGALLSSDTASTIAPQQSPLLPLWRGKGRGWGPTALQCAVEVLSAESVIALPARSVMNLPGATGGAPSHCASCRHHHGWPP